VLEDIYPVRWAGKQAVVTLPEDIDVSNAGQIREQLLTVINRGAAVLIADMTATVSCDYAGGEAVFRAYRRAVISGTDLRLVVTAQIVRRLLSYDGLDRLVSIYPSLEAAQAVRTPADVLGLVPGPASVRADDQALPRCTTPGGSNLPAARPSDRNRAAVTSAEVWSLVDALQDGVALADGDGALAMASRRLEEMFGYERGELLGRTVECLIPADLQAAHRSHRATYAEAPRTRPMSDRLVGLRKDGTTFPVEISLSPVTTAAGHFAFAVIRDVAAARHLEDLIDLVRSAVTAEQA
jgi:anti-anti-sigma factor